MQLRILNTSRPASVNWVVQRRESTRNAFRPRITITRTEGLIRGSRGDRQILDAKNSADAFGKRTAAMFEDRQPPIDEPIDEKEFRFVLSGLMAAYQPALERELKRTRDLGSLSDQSRRRPPSCGEEIALANQIFKRFFTEEMVERIVGPNGRRIAGGSNEWVWCARHVRCCVAFGWLVSRGWRTFRSFAYYLYRYWICVREAIGTPVSNPLTDAERRDFQVLVKALAGAYKPCPADQLACGDFPCAISEEVPLGDVERREEGRETAAIFDRLVTVETTPALLGRAFQIQPEHPLFHSCRGWFPSAIRFGCRLSAARDVLDVTRSLRRFFADTRRSATASAKSPANARFRARPVATSLLTTLSPRAPFAD